MWGRGGVIFDINGTQCEKIGYKLDHRHSIYTCELYAILQILSKINESECKECVILTDSLSVLTTIEGGGAGSRPDLMKECYYKINGIKAKHIVLDLCWIPSHVGIQGNEEADKIAVTMANSTEETIVNLPINKAEAYAIVKKRAKNFWIQWCQENCKSVNAAKGQIRRKPLQYSKNVFADRAITRLRIGENNLKGESHRQHHNRCHKCNKDLDFEHIFFERTCKELNLHRDNLEQKLYKLG